MDISDAKKLVNLAKELGINRYVLIGGEPTIYPNIFELCNYINENNGVISIATNGKRLKDSVFVNDLIQSGVSHFDLSLKAVDEDEYVLNCGAKGLEDYFSAYSNIQKNSKASVTVSFVLTKHNSNALYLKKLLDLCLLHKVKQILFVFEKPSLSDSNFDFDLTTQAESLNDIINIFSNQPLRFKINVSFPLCLIRDDVLKKLESGNHQTCCHLQRDSGLVVDENFNLLFCNHFAEFPYGNIKEMNFNGNELLLFLDNKEMTELKKNFHTFPSDKCASCNFWDKCGGGCFINWLNKNPIEYIK